MTQDTQNIQNIQWWQRGVIYQVYPRSFYDSDGDGLGDLNGLIAKLDYLRDLGIDAVWVSPFYPSPDADFGYDVTDHTAVDPRLGDLAAFDRLLAGLHDRGMKLIIDLVVTYVSDQHPWFIEARASRTSPKRDWFLWADAKPDGSPPNNWLSAFGGSGWQWDSATGQYYYHSFTAQQPDLNWRNPDLQAAMYEIARFWLERGVDGFRIDAAHWILKDPDLRDNPPNTAPPSDVARSMGEYDTQLHLYDKGHPNCHAVFAAYRRLIDSYSTPEHPRFAVGEIHVFDWPEWAKYYGENLTGLHMPFNFGLVGAAWRVPVIRGVVEGVEAAVPAGGWPNYVLGNHDEPRIAGRIGRVAARAAMLLLLTLRGTPTIYQGDEIGMENGIIPPDRILDPWGKFNPAMNRDVARTPFQWSAGPNAGFSPAGGKTWLPTHPNADSGVNVADQEPDPASMLNLTRALLRLRRGSVALYGGTYQTIPHTPEDVYAYLRSHGADRLLIVLNFAADSRPVGVRGSGDVLLSTDPERPSGTVDLAALRLHPHEGLIIKIGAEIGYNSLP